MFAIIVPDKWTYICNSIQNNIGLRFKKIMPTPAPSLNDLSNYRTTLSSNFKVVNIFSAAEIRRQIGFHPQVYHGFATCPASIPVNGYIR